MKNESLEGGVGTSHNTPAPVDEVLLFWLSTDSNEKDKQRAHKEEGELFCQAKSAVLMLSLLWCAMLSKALSIPYTMLSKVLSTPCTMLSKVLSIPCIMLSKVLSQLQLPCAMLSKVLSISCTMLCHDCRIEVSCCRRHCNDYR